MEYWDSDPASLIWERKESSGIYSSKYFRRREFGESLVLVLDTRSNMTPKYGTGFFIIIRHYKWEDYEIDADQ